MSDCKREKTKMDTLGYYIYRVRSPAILADKVRDSVDHPKCGGAASKSNNPGILFLHADCVDLKRLCFDHSKLLNFSCDIKGTDDAA